MIRRALVPDASAAVAARRALDGLGPGLQEDVCERSALALTEVVTNSVRHAGLRPDQRIDLKIAVLPDTLHIDVTDDGEGFEWVPSKPATREGRSGGWGLWLVDQLTDRWGIDVRHSTRVWCEFDLGPG